MEVDGWRVVGTGGKAKGVQYDGLRVACDACRKWHYHGGPESTEELQVGQVTTRVRHCVTGGGESMIITLRGWLTEEIEREVKQRWRAMGRG
jgi:hypothetical protein